MRPFAVVVGFGLTACWAATPSSSPPKRTAASTPAAAAAAPQAAYELPQDVAGALAAQPVRGNVLVATMLYPTAAAARADAKASEDGTLAAMPVVRDHGEVVEVATRDTDDCAASFGEPYELTGFVRRDRLVLRANSAITRTYPDGTAVAIDRGAAIEIATQGLAWRSTALAETAVRPREDQLTYAVPAKLAPAALPKPAGERMVCAGGLVQSEAAWRQARHDKRDAERRAKAEELHAECEERRAEERARAAKRKKKKKDPNKLGGMGELFTSDIACPPVEAFMPWGSGGGFEHGYVHVPWCGIADPAEYSLTGNVKATPPELNGVAVSWPSDGHDHVFAANGHYFADVQHRCGRTRLAVEREGVRNAVGGGVGMIGGGHRAQVQAWVPAPGPVTWPDGTPAGKYTGRKKYRTVVDKVDRICVRVQGVAELVCHDKRTARTEMVSPYGF